jgi:NAD(P)-dependent dehydrogenase (short-subunit alcohol dehydrogenase family)
LKELTREGQTPTGITDVIDINLNGTLYFARLAVAYLKEKHSFDKQSSTPENITSPKCITLVSSVAGFKESPGLAVYSAAKHGVMGLMRALRPFTSQLYGLRVNAICTSCLLLPISVPGYWGAP